VTPLIAAGGIVACVFALVLAAIAGMGTFFAWRESREPPPAVMVVLALAGFWSLVGVVALAAVSR
jgi:hypothetical protein